MHLKQSAFHFLNSEFLAGFERPIAPIIIYFILNLKTNGIKTSNITDQIVRIGISIIYCQTMQPSKMLTDTINILKVEAEKEYLEDSNLMIKSLKNELISVIKGEKGDS